jgi:hypothetical protein
MLNANKNVIKSVQNIEDVRYIINVNDNVESLANGGNLLFYNKKSKKFINSAEKSNKDLGFEKELFRLSHGDQDILQDYLMRIKIVATRIYKEIVETTDLKKVVSILEEYESTFPRLYWSKILEFTQNFYKIVIPNKISEAICRSNHSSVSPKNRNQSKHDQIDCSREYELILSSHRNIAQGFVSLLHEYRVKHVNPANLEIIQLYDPKELYNYLRNHHWKDGIPSDFIEQWSNFKEELTEEEYDIFHDLFSKLNISINLSKLNENSQHDKVSTTKKENDKPIVKIQSSDSRDNQIKHDIPSIPSINNFEQFRNWIMSQLDEIEKRIRN